MHLQENSRTAAAFLVRIRDRPMQKEVRTTADGQSERINADSFFRSQTPSSSQWQVLLTPCLHQRYHIRLFFQGKFP